MNSKQIGIFLFLFFLFALLPLLPGQNAQAQDISLEGRVIDFDTEEPLIGVNIIVVDTDRGTTTDLNGNFQLRVNLDDVLSFRYVGYQSAEVPVDGRSSITVELRSEAIYGDEVVVIGYGERRVEDNTGSIRRVSSDNFNVGAISSPGELFKGKVPGVNVTSADGAPGSGPTIRIRGGSSLSASNEPLYVIDGVTMPPGGISGVRDPLSNINPNDIESITVLRDASATAIYGSRASNGVIMIETKSGQIGQPLSLSYTGRYSYETERDRVDVLSAGEFRDLIVDHFGDRGQERLGEFNTNWQDQIYSNVFTQDHNISLSGAYEQLPYHLSVGFTDDHGLLETSNNQRLTGAVRLTPSFLNGDLGVDFNLRGTRDGNRFAPDEAISTALAFDPTSPVRDDDSPFGGYYAVLDADGTPIDIAPNNPVALVNQTRDESTVYRTIGNLRLDYTLPFIPDLQASLNLGFDYSDVGDGTVRVPADAAFQFVSPVIAGERTEYDQRRENQLLDFYLNYDTDLEDIRSNIAVTAGYSWSHNYEEGSTYSTNYNRQDTLIVNTDTEYKTENYLVSYFGRANYSLMNRYRLTATMRADGSSRFSEDNRWGYFPSMAVAWNLNREPFMRRFDRLSNLTLRLGYGITGQQEILQGNYPYLARYTFSEMDARYRFGDEYVQTLRPEGYNTELKWEETTTYNLALDYGFINNRIQGSIEAYHRTTDDLLNVIPVPAGTNFTNRIISNIGTLEVQGLEFDISATPIVTRDMFWNVSFNASYSFNEITQLTAVDDPGYIGVETGGIAGGVGNTIQIHSVGHPRSSFYVYEQVYDRNGNPVEGAFVDRNGDGRITSADMYHLGSPDPDFVLGFSSSFNYRNWDATVSARAHIGNYVYNNVESQYGFYDELLYGQYLRNATTSIKETGFVNARFHSDHYVEDASFFRMDNISAGYTFPNLLDLGTSVRLSGTVNNVFLITKYSGLDPEVFGGIDNQIYPRPRTFVLGLNIDL